MSDMDEMEKKMNDVERFVSIKQEINADRLTQPAFSLNEMFNRLTSKIPFNPQESRKFNQNQDNLAIQINASVTSRLILSRLIWEFIHHGITLQAPHCVTAL